MTESTYIVPGAPRLALLSDLHGRPYQEAVRLVRGFRPEMICITGDLITGILPEDDISPLVSQPYVSRFWRSARRSHRRLFPWGTMSRCWTKLISGRSNGPV